MKFSGIREIRFLSAVYFHEDTDGEELNDWNPEYNRETNPAKDLLCGMVKGELE